jgi:hypothetical protein
MAKKPSHGPSLFDVIDEQVARETVAETGVCTHERESPTETVWPGETCTRLTMTCDICQRVRGRYPGEPYVNGLRSRLKSS